MSEVRESLDGNDRLRVSRSVRDTASSARFLLLSLVIHVAIVFVLAYWSLPTVVDLIVTKLHDAEAALQPFDNNQHQSHEDGKQAWEKLADVQGVAKVVDVVRRESEPINIPNQSEDLQPTITVQLARRFPSEHVLFTPPRAAAQIREPQLSGRTMASSAAAVDIDEPLEELIPAESPEMSEPALPEAQPAPREETIAATSLRRLVAPRIAMTLQPVELEESLPEAPDVVETDAPRSRATTPATAAEITDDLESLVIPLDKAAKLPLKQAQQVAVKRQPSVSHPVTPPMPPTRLEEAVEKRPRPIETKGRELARPSEPGYELDRERPVVDAQVFSPIDPAEPAPALAAVERSPDRHAMIELVRGELSPPAIELPRPREIAGPSRPKQRLAIGELGPPLDVPPTFGPIVSQLARPRAKSTRVVYAEDSVGLREMFTIRQSDIRKQYIELFGGTPKSEVAVDKGLEWLATHQNGDGSWSLNNFHANCKGKHANCSGAGSVKSDSAATGLAMLPFLAAGYTHREGPYQKKMTAAADWLLSHQKETGDLLAPGDQQHLYSHSIASIAACELYGMTGDEKYRPLAEKALAFIVKSQHGATGGWRYSPNQAADTSVVGWAMMALKSGEMAGITPPKPAVDNVARWLKSVEGNKPTGGVFGYQNANATPAMTAEGLLCLQFMGLDRNSPRMRAGADYLLTRLPKPNQSGTSYYWYYGTQVMYHMQGDYWNAWNEKLRDHLVSTQIAKGAMAGTWDVRDNWERTAGRVYATSLKLLMLEVYYRHLPLYEQFDD